MYIRPKIITQLNQVLMITLFWVLCGAFLALYKCVTYDIQSASFIFKVPKELPLGSFLLINLIGPVIGGLIGGSTLVFVLNETLRKKSYGHYLAVNILIFFIFIFTMNTAVSYFFYYQDEINPANILSQGIGLMLLDPYAIRNIITWMIIAFLTLHGLKIYEKYGPGTLFSMFMGRYHRPHEVGRVFMFLDLRNSTMIAEKLGHKRFFSMLNDFFIDATDPILNSQGEIYQYVGDEVVISWSLNKAFSDKTHCIDCFFNVEESLLNRESYYLKQYGIFPTFKAALHTGSVVVGEIGIIKKEIVYSGDILNTTSRMMEQCNLQNQKFIISKDIVEMVPEKIFDRYDLVPLGDLSLRGKLKPVGLYGVTKQENLHAPEKKIFNGRIKLPD